ncbi:ATP-binding protein [Plantactinospora soyae]|uniref:DNA-binding CsgD family transcriptional regulator/tetratricopeptide (TPR) repeat protein n=1 Tax=Plantactinospora soyae TaxID=1544732 RepID=A0A927MCR0_9ACTN|nr:AAA family ATPase [Plantactinospora soyae]MBE1490721.1 DNA-binding CsgD family transcriptional regulator/tetratricopeptide (TPR) repeat protein [Plantactinospora soyae]
MRTIRGGASPMMIGRESELRRLTQLASARESAVAIIAGEPGIGKTRLVHELLTTVPAETVVLVGQAEPGSLSRPYEVLLDAIDGRPEVDEEQLAALADPRRSPVERLHTGLAILADLIGDSPAVIVFEDLHWADSESAALFERIADQRGPRLLVGTYRPDEVTRRQPVAGLLVRMERRHTVTHVRLDRLTPAQTAALLAAATGAPAPMRAVTALHHRTGGNPFFLEELLRALPGYDLEALVEQPLPWSLADVLRRQVDDLDPVSHRIVEAAAVLGHRIPFDLLADVTGTAEDELIAVLRDLVTRGVLVESGDDEFAFRHALVREAIADQMLGRQRRRLHEAALDVLLNGGASDPAMVAHHACGAGRYDDMIAAARRGTALYLSLGSAYQALQLAEMGLDEVPDDTDLLASAARAAWLAGLLDDALRYGRRWRDLAGTTTDRAESLYLLVRIAWESRETDEMRALTHDIGTLIAQLPPGADQARAMTAIAQSAYLRGDLNAALLWSDRALVLADEFDLSAVRLAALFEKGSTLSAHPQTAADGRKILSTLVDEAEEAGEWVLAARALNILVQGEPPTSPAEYAATLERMRVDAERAGFESLAVATYFQGRARLALRAGDLRAAIGALEEGREQDRSYRRRGRWADYHGVFLAGLHLEAGALDQVEQLITDLAALPDNPSTMIPGLAFHLACRRGDLPHAEASLDELIAALPEQTWRSNDQAHDLISAALDIGLPAHRLDQMATALLDTDVWDAYRTLVDAQLAEARGQHAEALAGYLPIAEAHILGPATRGTVRVGAARCLLADDRREEASTQVEAAVPLLAKWHGWRVAQLAQVRAQLGMAPVDAAPALTGPAALTPREREVAVLISDGLTNTELARRLYISPKTAAVHVSNILRKLGASSRTEVGDLVGRH